MNEVAGKDQESSLNAIEPPTCRVRLIARREVAKRTMALFFERPVGFSFKAGQFIDLMLLDPTETDSEGNTRAFTIASAPSEERLMIVIGMLILSRYRPHKRPGNRYLLQSQAPLRAVNKYCISHILHPFS